MAKNIVFHEGDLPSSVVFKGSVAVDTEAMGLNPHRDRLCVVQLSGGDGVAHVVQVSQNKTYDCPNLKRVLADQNLLKIFHYARFDVGILQHYLGIEVTPVFCTKVASRILRNFTSRHGLKSLLSDLLSVEISKQNQSSDWGALKLSDEQIAYAATDVLYLHKLKGILEEMMDREGRRDLIEHCFAFIPAMAKLDLLGYEEFDYFRHS